MTLLALAAMLRGVDLPRPRRRPTGDAVTRDLDDEIELHTLLRRLRDATPWSGVGALTDAHLRALLSG